METSAQADTKLRRALQQTGWLNKQGHWRKNWASRWFSIVNHPDSGWFALNYYKSKPEDYEGNNGSYDGSAIECGSIPLFGATVFPRSGDGHPFGFSVTTAMIAGTSKTFPLRATSYEERRRWVDALTIVTTGRPTSLPGLELDRSNSLSPFSDNANVERCEGKGEASTGSGGETGFSNGASSTSSGPRVGRSKSWFGGSFSDRMSQSSSNSNSSSSSSSSTFGNIGGRILSSDFFRKTTSAAPSIVESLRDDEATAERDADLSLAESLLVEAQREEKAVFFELAARHAQERTLLTGKSDSPVVAEDEIAQPNLSVDATVALAHRTVELYRKAAELFEEHDDNEGNDTSVRSYNIDAASSEIEKKNVSFETNGAEEREKPRWAVAMENLRNFLKHPKVQALFATEVPAAPSAVTTTSEISSIATAAVSDNSTAAATSSVNVK